MKSVAASAGKEVTVSYPLSPWAPEPGPGPAHRARAPKVFRDLGLGLHGGYRGVSLMLTAHRAPSSPKVGHGPRLPHSAGPGRAPRLSGRACARWCGRLLPRRPQKHTINDLAKARNRK